VAGGAAESGRSVASRVTAILLAFLSGGGHSLTELARLTGLPVSTTHRLLGELTSRRVLERTPDGDYRIGLALRMIGEADEPDHASLLNGAAAAMTDVAGATGSPVRLGVLAEYRVLMAEVTPDRNIVGGLVTDPRPAPMTALGRALLAFSPPAVVDEALATTDAHDGGGVASPDRLRRALATIRLTRVAVRRPAEGNGPGSVAVPVFGTGGVLLAALEADVPDMRASADRTRAALIVAAGSLSREFASAVRAEDGPGTEAGCPSASPPGVTGPRRPCPACH
jgi:DNA-binding IclR family transcriptional regulator